MSTPITRFVGAQAAKPALVLAVIALVLSAPAAAQTAGPTVTADGDTTEPSGQATVVINIEDGQAVGLSNIPSTWSVAEHQDSGSTFNNQIDNEEVVGWVWFSGNQDSKTVSITFDVPADATTQTLDVTAEDSDGNSAETDVTVTVEDQNQHPDASLDVDPTTVEVDQSVTFDGTRSNDPDGEITEYRWDFDGDGTVDRTTTTATPTYAYSDIGTYDAELTVVDDDGATSSKRQAISVVSPDDENDIYEPNDEIDSATEISPNDNLDARVVGFDPDIYEVSLSEGERLTASIFFDDSDANLQLVVGNEDAASSEDVGNGSFSSTDDERASVTAVADEPYYIAVVSQNNNTADYTLRTETGDNTDTGFVSGTVTDTTLDHPVTNADVTIRDSSGSFVQEATTDSSGEYTVELIPGEYTVEVSTSGYEPVEEPVSVTAGTTTMQDISLAEQDYNDEYEPNDEIDTATSVADGTYADLQVVDGESDYFAIEVQEGDSVNASIDFAHDTGDLDMALYSPDQEQVDSSWSTTDDELVSVADASAGTYYVEVYGFAGASASYDLSINTDSSEPIGFISGRVSDSSNNDIPDASVTIEDTSGSVVAETTTTDSGVYTVEIPPGEYTVIAEKNDRTGESGVVSVSSGRTSSANIILDAEESDELTAERTLSITEAGPGETVTVTIDTELAEAGGIQVTDTFNSQLEVEITDGFGGLDNVVDGEATFNNPTGTNNQYTVAYEVTIPEDATIGTTYEFTGSVQGESERAISGEDSITVRDNAWYDSYTGNDDVVSEQGLNAAVGDYLAGDMTDVRLNEIIQSYLSGGPIEN